MLYTALGLRGFYDCRHFDTLRQFDSILQGHPCMKKTPGLDMTSGSLGNGLSIGVGMALGAKLDGLDYRVFVMMGDGELQEGMVWEALMAGAKYKLDNLYLIIDYNHLQVDGTVEEIMDIAPLRAKLEAFNWQVAETRHLIGARELSLMKPSMLRPPPPEKFGSANGILALYCCP